MGRPVGRFRRQPGLAGLPPGQRDHPVHARGAHAAGADPARHPRARVQFRPADLRSAGEFPQGVRCIGPARPDLRPGHRTHRDAAEARWSAHVPADRREHAGDVAGYVPRARLPHQQDQDRRTVCAGRDRFRRRHVPAGTWPARGPLPARSPARCHLRHRQPGPGAGGHPRDRRVAQAGHGVEVRTRVVAVRRLCARLPLATVQRRQHRLHQRAVPLHGDRQPGPEAGNQRWRGTGRPLRREGGVRQPVGLLQPLRRLHRVDALHRLQR